MGSGASAHDAANEHVAGLSDEELTPAGREKLQKQLTLVKEQAEAEEKTKALEALVLCGPVIGTVTDTTANVLLEVDSDITLTCTATPASGEPVTATHSFKAANPAAFKLEGLAPQTEYTLTFGPLPELQVEELKQRGSKVVTLPTEITKLRIIALSCDRPTRMLEGQENPWNRLATICKNGECDIMLHLGDQVYTKDNGWKASSVRLMDQIEHPSITPTLKLKMEREGGENLQRAYRTTWYPDGVATSLAHSSHLMIWSDNDVANDFTILKKADGSQAYKPAFLRVGMRVYRMYQRQLWDPDAVTAVSEVEKLPEIEEWHFHRYGSCGIFLIDMRGNRINPNGTQKEGKILSERQRAAIEKAFAEPGLTCMLVCSEIPFVGDPPDVIREKAKELTFLEDHWPYQIEELTWLLDLCFSFKAAAAGRDVIMIGGDIHVSVDSTITDSTTGATIRHITTSPITNHVCKFFPDLAGSLSDRYSYTHKALPDVRTYCTVDLTFSGETVTPEVNLVSIPVGAPKKEH